MGWADPSLVSLAHRPLSGRYLRALPSCLPGEGRRGSAGPPNPPCSHSAGCSQPGCSTGGHRGSWAVPPLGRSLIHGEFEGVRGWGKGPPCPPLRLHSLHAKPWGVGQPLWMLGLADGICGVQGVASALLSIWEHLRGSGMGGTEVSLLSLQQGPAAEAKRAELILGMGGECSAVPCARTLCAIPGTPVVPPITAVPLRWALAWGYGGGQETP